MNKAIETEDEIEIEEVEEIEGEAELEVDAEPEEVEIVVEGGEEPSSETVPLASFMHRMDKLKGRVESANTDTDTANRRADMFEEENKLLRLKSTQTHQRPKPEDFDNDDLFEAAKEKYDDQRADERADKRFEQRFADSQATVTRQTQGATQDANLKAHYERAESLKVKDYEATEDKAIEALGVDLSKFIMANTENSEIVMFHLGKNPGKALALAQKIASDPGRGAIAIGGLSSSLKIKPKSKTASDPETHIDPGNKSGKKGERGPKGAKFW